MTASHRFDESFPPLRPAPMLVEAWQPSFARQIKGLRVRYGRKQAWLASAVGCTDAAVSMWESGKRLPQGHLMFRIVAVLTQVGAPPSDIANLRRSWREEKVSRLELDCKDTL
jgi:DNA-binding XRE family transcriptional regulator